MGHGNGFEQLSGVRRLRRSKRRDNSVGSAEHRFESQRYFERMQSLRRNQLRLMLSSPAKNRLRSISRHTSSPPDDSLRAMVDACVSNVAVLDESGSIIYASNAWDLLERNFEGKTGA